MSITISDSNVEALASFLVENSPLTAAEEVNLQPFGDGYINETYLLTWDESEYIVRTPLPIDVVPELYNDLRREYEVLAALEDTAVSTPSVVAACDDESVIGDWFSVSERVPGDVMAETELARIDDREARRAVGYGTIDALAAVHQVDYEAVGLGDLGEPTRTLEDEIDRLSAQMEWAKERTVPTRQDAELVHGRLDETKTWLQENIPEQHERTLVHGDYKPDNLLWAPGLPVELEVVLDWELATVSDPRTDLGLLLAFWYENDDPYPITDTMRETYEDHDYLPLLDMFVYDYVRFMEHVEYPGRQELVTRYEDKTGIEFTDERFFRTLGVYKIATILESFYGVYLDHPEHAKPTYPAMELVIPGLALWAEWTMTGEIPL